MILDRSLDELKGLNIRLIQPLQGFRVNVDTVLLAGFSKVRRGERVCELGCAHGAVSLILAGRG
ncbi:MAG: methyltransferase, partial [Dethiosulfovibrio sp.]|nr:methyltransferase [Dethiosulfovibrio sp.]